jgi:leucyl aminopeptidase
MNYSLQTNNLLDIKSDCICLPIFQKKDDIEHEVSALCKLGLQIDEACANALTQAITRFDISCEAGKAFILPIDNQNFNRVLLVGFGDAKKVNTDTLKKAIVALTTQIHDTNIKSLCIAFDEVSSEISASQIVRDTIVAVENSHYSFDQFKTKKTPASLLSEITFHSNEAQKASGNTAILQTQAQVKGTNKAKDLGNLPGNVCTPTYLAEQAQLLALNSENISVKILEESDLEALNMGAFLSVSKGSTEPGKLVILEYKGGKEDEAPHVLVGKGITFDTGGISLKPGPSMDEMKYDMCGAASVLGTMTAIAELQPKLNIVSIIACAENMPAGNASKPGDIVTSASGITIEILNTDAEGRLVLCDALTYAEQYQPASVVDIATLTGACIVALGHSTSAVMGNDDTVINALLAAGKQADDKAWQLPLWDEYQSQIDSPFADIQNIGGKGAGSITAGCFLSRFAKEFPWAHLDVAGTAWVSGGKEKGATGRPVPLLLTYLLNKEAS